MSPVGRDASLTVDDFAAPAGAFNHSIRAVHPNNLIDTGSAVGHPANPPRRPSGKGVISPYLLAKNAAELDRRV
jgi:hypothetical protein